MTKFAEMGKVELRAACKLNGVTGYSKMDNAGMRAALEAVRMERIQEECDAIMAMAAKMDLSQLDQHGVEGHCPCCGIDLDNGLAHYDDICDSNKVEAGKMVREWTCLGCGGEWGSKIDRQPQAAPTGKGLKIEANREERNGIKRPSVGGKCRAIWDWLDAHPATPTAKNVRAQAEEAGWNPNNAVIEFYQWRKFNGVTGRAK